MKNRILILVANRNVAKLFESRSFRDELKPIKLISNPFFSKERGLQENDADTFARHLAFMLDREQTRHRFAELVLVAEPGFLGKLRTHFGRRSGCLSHVRTVNKELTHMNAKQLGQHIADILEEVWHDPVRAVRNSGLALSA